MKWIGDFWIPFNLFLEVTPDAHPFIWKWLFVHKQISLFQVFRSREKRKAMWAEKKLTRDGATSWMPGTGYKLIN